MKSYPNDTNEMSKMVSPNTTVKFCQNLLIHKTQKWHGDGKISRVDRWLRCRLGPLLILSLGLVDKLSRLHLWAVS